MLKKSQSQRKLDAEAVSHPRIKPQHVTVVNNCQEVRKPDAYACLQFVIALKSTVAIEAFDLNRSQFFVSMQLLPCIIVPASKVCNLQLLVKCDHACIASKVLRHQALTVLSYSLHHVAFHAWQSAVCCHVLGVNPQAMLYWQSFCGNCVCCLPNYPCWLPSLISLDSWYAHHTYLPGIDVQKMKYSSKLETAGMR